MSLVAQLSALATRIGTEIKGLIRPDHPGLARAWVNFGYVGGAIQLRAAYNVAAVTRLGTGRYRIEFILMLALTSAIALMRLIATSLSAWCGFWLTSFTYPSRSDF